MKTIVNVMCPVQDQKLNQNGSNLIGYETLKAGTLSYYTPGTYRTKDGLSFFKFRFVELGNGKYEVDILEQPSYRGRDDDARVVHRLPSARGGKKICVNVGYEPVSLHKAQKLAMEWAELTNTYIKTGMSIDYQVRLNSMR